MSSVQSLGFLRLNSSLMDPADTTKRTALAFTQPTNTTITVSFPPASTTLVGTDSSQTLTNKTITDASNNIAANSLKTTGASVTVSGSAPPTANQIITADTATTASWKTAGLTYLNAAGTVTTPSLSDIKRWNGYVSTSGLAATFYVSTNGLISGPAIFTDLTLCHFQATARNNTTNIVDIPFVSIRSINNATREVIVNVLQPTGILIGGVSMKNNATACTVYLQVVGV